VKVAKKPSAAAKSETDPSVDPLSIPFGVASSSSDSSTGGKVSGGGSQQKSFSFAVPASTMSLPAQDESNMPMQLQQSQQQHQTQSLSLNSSKMTKPQFTSIEKMILKGSFSFNRSISEDDKRSMQIEETTRIGKVSRMPDPLQIVQRQESIEELEEGRQSQVEADKPRRKYISAQDKIQKELQEQIKREKGKSGLKSINCDLQIGRLIQTLIFQSIIRIELSQLRAKWKSTPDLSKMEEEHEMNGVHEDVSDAKERDDESVDEYLPTKPSALRRQRQLSQSTQKIDEVSTSDVLKMNKPTVRRRQSALINQWEEMIKQQQEKNKP
jgi:hypothetical protein